MFEKELKNAVLRLKGWQTNIEETKKKVDFDFSSSKLTPMLLMSLLLFINYISVYIMTFIATLLGYRTSSTISTMGANTIVAVGVSSLLLWDDVCKCMVNSDIVAIAWEWMN